MEIKDFIEETRDLEQYYEKQLDEFQRKIWYNELKEISLPRYRQIIRQILRTSKFMPKLSDVLEISKTMTYVAENANQEKVECNKCNSEGIITYTKIIENLPYLFVARCTCKNGEKYRYDGREMQEHKSKYYIPSIEEIGG